MDKIRLALIGCGRIAYKHIEALSQHSSQAVCDILPEKAQAKTEAYYEKMISGGEKVIKPEVLTDYREILGSSAVDAVIIATESGKHAKIAKAFLAQKTCAGGKACGSGNQRCQRK